ncbi:MAG: glutamine-hydrolyzing GMP synthase [Candidatus Thorarchaeota archaeon]
MPDLVVVIDYGGQYTHLIARRCRELGVFAEIVPQDQPLEFGNSSDIKGVIMSGGPRTAGASDLDFPFDQNLASLKEYGIPVLGICFGHQLLAIASGAKLAAGGNPEYGSTIISIKDSYSILRGLSNGQRVWMSHSDQVTSLPSSIAILATTGDGHVAAFEDQESKRFGVQFHPEVFHTPNGMSVLDSFLRDVCGFTEQWTPESLIDDIIESIRVQVGNGRVLMGTSGGVDSTVAAFLIKEAIGDRLYCVFVDNGLLRAGEVEEVTKAFKEMGFEHFEVADAGKEFLNGLTGIEDPEEKRRIIADTFIRVFERRAKALQKEYGEFDFLGQGTIYPDRVESAATGKATAVIKSHHNVRLPEWMKLKLVEPLKDLYKDEVRQVGLKMNIPPRMIHRQPFPGPSLAIRIGGPVNEEQLSLLRHADTILQEELAKDPIYPSVWQSFCVLLPVKSVGVMGDERTYDQAVVIRIVESLDAMTASVSRPSWDILLDIASRIANEVKGINRVVYDLTTKPPSTIEWY